MSMNPARTFGPAAYGGYWHALWIYFVAPTVGMLAAAEVFLWARRGTLPSCTTPTTSAAYFTTALEEGACGAAWLLPFERGNHE